MPIDPSVYASLGQQQSPPNLFGPLTSFAYAQNALNQNKLFQQTFAARQAMGPLAQASIDPQTGQMDYNKFATLISTHPETAFMAPDIINGMVARQLTQAQIVNQQIDAAVKRQGAIGSAAAGLISQYGDSVQPKHLVGAVSDLVGEGILETPQAVSYLSQFGGQSGPALKAHLAQIAAGSLRSADMGSQVLGTFRPDAITNADGSKSPGFSSALFGQVKPATLAGGTYGQGAPAPAPAATPNAAASAALGAPSATGVPAPAPAPSLGGSAPGSQVVSSLSPFALGRQQEAAKYGQDVAERAQSANNLMAQLNITQRYLRDVKSGAFTESRVQLANAMRTLGMPEDTVNAVAGGDLNDAQAAMKSFLTTATQSIAQLVHTAGGGRLAQQEWAQYVAKGSPNLEMTPQAIQKVMNSMRELASYTDLENRFYQLKSNTPNYNMGNVQNDYQSYLARAISAKEAQENGAPQQ